MPHIRPSADLRNNYNEISTFCHENREPVYITKNGKGDLAVMSIAECEYLHDKLEMYRKLWEGLNAEKEGKVRPARKVISDMREKYGL